MADGTARWPELPALEPAADEAVVEARLEAETRGLERRLRELEGLPWTA